MYFAVHSRKNSRIFTEHRFVCSVHSEAKQTETSEFGADRGLLQGHERSQVASLQKTHNF